MHSFFGAVLLPGRHATNERAKRIQLVCSTEGQVDVDAVSRGSCVHARATKWPGRLWCGNSTASACPRTAILSQLPSQVSRAGYELVGQSAGVARPASTKRKERNWLFHWLFLWQLGLFESSRSHHGCPPRAYSILCDVRAQRTALGHSITINQLPPSRGLLFGSTGAMVLATTPRTLHTSCQPTTSKYTNTGHLICFEILILRDTSHWLAQKVVVPVGT
jgi:hypothetical protein